MKSIFIIKQSALCFLLFTSIGCSRLFDDNKESKLTIVAPTKQQLLGKAGALGTPFPAGYDYCYGVNIEAPDLLTSGANTCSPAVGLFKGYVPAGSNIEISAPRGNNRNIYVYLHLVPTGSGCPVSTTLNNGKLDSVYKIGEALNVNFDAAEITVQIQADFPGLSNHVASTIAAPDSCLDSGGSGQSLKTGVASLAGDVTSTSYKLRNNIKHYRKRTELNSTSYKIKR